MDLLIFRNDHLIPGNDTGRSEINFFQSSFKSDRRLKKRFLKSVLSNIPFTVQNMRLVRKSVSIQKCVLHSKHFFDSNSFFESTSGPDPGSDLHIVRAVFGTPFWPKSSRNDRFYKGLAPERGSNLGPAGRPPAGQPGPAKNVFSIQD